jgi:hypothetical protein
MTDREGQILQRMIDILKTRFPNLLAKELIDLSIRLLAATED